MLVNSALQPNTSPVSEPAELSPLWGLTLVLGEIALRVEREQAGKQMRPAQVASERPEEDAARARQPEGGVFPVARRGAVGRTGTTTLSGLGPSH